MLRITGNKDEIIVREINADELLNAFFIIPFSAYFFYSAFSSEKSSSGAIWALCALLPVLIYFLYKALNLAPITTKINRADKIISVRRQSLFKYNFNVYSFNEIESRIYLNFVERKVLKPKYQLTVPLKDGRQIGISALGGSRESQFFEAVDLINEFIFDSHGLTPLKLYTFNND